MKEGNAVTFISIQHKIIFRAPLIDIIVDNHQFQRVKFSYTISKQQRVTIFENTLNKIIERNVHLRT